MKTSNMITIVCLLSGGECKPKGLFRRKSDSNFKQKDERTLFHP